MFLVNSRYRRFSAASSGSGSMSLHPLRHTFSRSYGVILPSSFTRVLSSALGFSPHPPVSVYGTITGLSRQGLFPAAWDQSLCGIAPSSSPLGVSGMRISLHSTPTGLNRHFHPADDLPFCVPPSLKRYSGGTGMLTCFPSPAPFGLGLGID